MTVNEGKIDRIIRAVLGVVLLYLAFLSGSPTFAAGFWHWIAIIAGVAMLVTAATGLCSLFYVFVIRTNK